MRRNFTGPGGAPLRVDVEAFSPFDKRFKFMLVGDALPIRDGVRRGVGRLKYRFEPDSGWRDAPTVTGYIEGEDALSFWSDLNTVAGERALEDWFRAGSPAATMPAGLLARPASVNRLVFAYPQRDDTAIELGSMDETLARLDECMRALMITWGYDLSASRMLRAQPAITNMGDLGRNLLARMEHARLRNNEPMNVRLHVDENGSITNCVVQFPVRNAELKKLICDLLSEKATITPARDANDRPVGTLLLTMFRFAAG